MYRKFLHIAIAAAAVIIASIPVRAQSDAMFTQYYEVPTFYNPGAIGTSDYMRFRALSRMQWIGIKHAPTTFAITGDAPLKLFNKRFGVGLVLQQETEGLYKNMSFGVQLGYKFKLLKGEFSAALQIGMVDESFDGSKIHIPDDDDYHESADEGLPTSNVRGNALDLGIGVHYTHKYFWAGLSCTHVNSPTITFDSDSGGSSTSGGESGDGDSSSGNSKNYEFQVHRALYFMGGSNIPIKNTLFEVIPSVMVASDFTFTTFEATARVRWKKFLSGGVGYRYEDALSVMLSAEYKGFFLGYSYDYPLSAISRASSGSHEIMAGYSLKLDFSEKNKNRHKSIRIM